MDADQQALYNQLIALLGPEREPQIRAFLRLVAKVRSGELTQDAAPAAFAGADLVPLIKNLAGRQVDDGNTLIAFGAGANTGDVAISDVAGGHVIKISITIHINNNFLTSTANTSPELTPPSDNNGWDELRVNQLYQHYQLPAHAQAWVDTVLTQPGCYVIEAPAQYGKTALVRHLWHTLRNAGYEVIGYLFSRHQQRSDIAEAIRQIRRQLLGIDLIGAGSPESLSIPWLPIDQAAGSGRNIAVLIDALDECQGDDDHRRLLDQLLPPFRFEHARLVVTSREPLSEYHVVLGTLLSEPETLRLTELNPIDIRGLARQRKVTNRNQLYDRIYAHTNSGEPVLVAAVLRSANPEFALQQPVHALQEPARIAALELEDMQRQADDSARSLLERLVALLAVSPTPLAFDEMRAILNVQDERVILQRLCKRLARYVKVRNSYTLANPIVRAYLLWDAETNGYYAGTVHAMRQAVAAWFRDQYYLNDDLKRVPSHILRHLPSYLLEARDPANFAGERIFADKRWSAALANGLGTLVDLRDSVAAAWRAAEQHESVCTRVLGVTTCALMITSLVPAFPPAAVADLVRRRMVTAEQAQRYVQAYRSPRERAEAVRWLRRPAQAPREHPFAAAFDRIAQHPHPPHDQQLHTLHEHHMQVGTRTPEVLLRALQNERDALLTGATAGAGWAPAPLPELIAQLRDTLADPRRPTALELADGDLMNAPLGLTYQGPSSNLSHVLQEIAEAWADAGADHDATAQAYCAITRLIAGDSRAFYCDALRILAPAIGRVFGKEYLDSMIAIVKAITAAYP